MAELSRVADGATDASPVLQGLLDEGGDITIPAGSYLLTETLRVHSDTSITAEPGAVFRLADGAGRHCRNFLITNANPGNGNVNISLRGGLWDGNNPGNPRGTDHEPFSYTGVAVNLTNVRRLRISGLTVRDPESFFVRVGEVSDFEIENITLQADNLRPNQDGIHVGGFSERGVIRGIRARGRGVPNDDMVALNADDDVERQLNLGMRRGPIRDILVEDIEAEDAYTFLRLLSVDNPIEDITVRRMKGGCRMHGVNLNNWRFPKGVGAIRRVSMEDIELTKTACSLEAPAVVKVCLAVDDITIRRLVRGDGTHPEVRTVLIDNRQDLRLALDGSDHTVTGDDGFVVEDGSVRAMWMGKSKEE